MKNAWFVALPLMWNICEKRKLFVGLRIDNFIAFTVFMYLHL